jgi:hypothetical protein
MVRSLSGGRFCVRKSSAPDPLDVPVVCRPRSDPLTPNAERAIGNARKSPNIIFAVTTWQMGTHSGLSHPGVRG